jgi:hypothetical protein
MSCHSRPEPLIVAEVLRTDPLAAVTSFPKWLCMLLL